MKHCIYNYKCHNEVTHVLHLELPSAEGVGDILNGVTEAVSIVIGGVDAPPILGSGVWLVLDPVRHWVLFTVFQGHLHA